MHTLDTTRIVGPFLSANQPQQQILLLQGIVGNQAVQRILQETGAPVIQRAGPLEAIKKRFKGNRKPEKPREPVREVVDFGAWDETLVKTEGIVGYRPSDQTFIVNGAPYKLQQEATPKGRGGLGTVWRLDPVGHTGPKLAIKVPNADRFTDLIELNKMMGIEARNQQLASGHENILKGHGVIGGLQEEALSGGHPVNAIIMELIDGSSLHRWVGAGGYLTLAYQFRWISYAEFVGVQQYVQREITKGLHYLHDLGLVHMDIKPENVMFDADFRVKIIDFGSLSPASGTTTAPPTTAKWASPEFLNPPIGATPPDAVKPAYDMYSSGLIAQGGLEPVSGPSKGEVKETAATQFVKKVAARDPGERATATEALDLPFLADPLIDDDAARAVLKFVEQRSKDSKTGTKTERASPREEPAPIGVEQGRLLDKLMQELRQSEVFRVKEAASRIEGEPPST